MTSLPTPREAVASLISSIRDTSTLEQSSNPLRDAPHDVQHALLTLHVLFPNELLPALDVLDRNLITRLKPIQIEARGPPDPQALPAPFPQARPQSNNENGLGYVRSVPSLKAARRLGKDDQLGGEDAEAETTSARHQSPHHLHPRSLDGQDPAPHHERPDTELPADTKQPRHAEVYVVRSGQTTSRSRMVNHTTSYEVRLDAWSCSCPAFAFSAFPVSTLENDPVPSNLYQHNRSAASPSWRFGGLTTGSDLPTCKHLLACVLVQHSNVFANFVEEREVSIEELAGWAAGWGD